MRFTKCAKTNRLSFRSARSTGWRIRPTSRSTSSKCSPALTSGRTTLFASRTATNAVEPLPFGNCDEIFARIAIDKHAGCLSQLSRATYRPLGSRQPADHVVPAVLANVAAADKGAVRIPHRSKEAKTLETGSPQRPVKGHAIEKVQMTRRIQRKPVLAEPPMKQAAGVRRRKRKAPTGLEHSP